MTTNPDGRTNLFWKLTPALSTVLRGARAREVDATEKRVLSAIANFHAIHRYGPSLEEIHRETQLTISILKTMLVNLRSRGLVLYERAIPRSLRLATDADRRAFRVAAWKAALAELPTPELTYAHEALRDLLGSASSAIALPPAPAPKTGTEG